MQVFSIILATSLRALEIALCAFYPNMPRFALLRSALSWVSRAWPPFAPFQRQSHQKLMQDRKVLASCLRRALIQQWASCERSVPAQVGSTASSLHKGNSQSTPEGAAEGRRNGELPVQPGWRSWHVLKTSFRQNMILTAPGRHLGSAGDQQVSVLLQLFSLLKPHVA